MIASRFQAKIIRSLCVGVAAAALTGFAEMSASGATAVFASPTTPAMDKWMYGNVSGIVGGQSDVAPVFAFPDDSGEDRLAGMVLAFQTSTQIQSGLDEGLYQITAIRLNVTVLTGDTFYYDPTYDSYRTVLDPTDPDYAADADTGKPLEVFGLGLRNGYTALTTGNGQSNGGLFGETSPFGTSGQVPFANAFPMGFNSMGTLFDVTGNVTDRSEAYPFGIGMTSSVDPGEFVPADTEFTFSLEITNPLVLDYVRDGLADGIIGFYVSGLHGAEGQGGPQTYPRLYTREGAVGSLAPELAPRLEVEFAIIPEPQLSGLLIIGIALLSAGRAFRHRNHLT